MIIEYLYTMWADLFMAGYRPPEPKPIPETWLECVTRLKRIVAEYLDEEKEKENG